MTDQRVIDAVRYFEYDPETGIIRYKYREYINPTPRQKQWKTLYEGKPCGYDKDGYIRCVMPTGELYAHQIAFAIMRGYIPEEIDHENTKRNDNRWCNLREATRKTNCFNSGKRSFNKSGLKGVSWSKSNNCWRMDIRAHNVRYHSYHKTKEDAYAAYCVKAIELHGEFANVG